MIFVHIQASSDTVVSRAVPKGASYTKKKNQESTQSKYVVESSNSTTIEPCSINTVQEVVGTDILYKY